MILRSSSRYSPSTVVWASLLVSIINLLTRSPSFFFLSVSLPSQTKYFRPQISGVFLLMGGKDQRPLTKA